MTDTTATGQRVWLRPLREADAVNLARSTLPVDYLTWSDRGRVPGSELAFCAWIREALPSDRSTMSFAICRIADDRCIGTTTLRDIDWINRTAETGSGLLFEEDRGLGLGTEAKHLLLAFAFETLGLHALSATVAARNRRSQAALSKQGYRLAGRLRATGHVDGRYVDTLIFDLLAGDWRAVRDQPSTSEETINGSSSSSDSTSAPASTTDKSSPDS